MKSFDIFDTLIARKCVYPQAIFSLVEQRTGMQGFAASRMEAERQVQGGEYSLDDIYQKLVAKSGISIYLADRAKQAELAAELENVIPIRQNLRCVSDGDILITDNYLPLEFVQLLLQHAGLRRKVSIIRSADGKATGRIWESLRRAGFRISHLGDSPHSDRDMPIKYGFEAVITDISRPNATEQYLLAQGFTGVALIARTLRLGLAGEVSIGHELQESQARINVPLLLLASLYLGRFMREQQRPYDSILFSSRDCRGWEKVFRAVHAGAGPGFPRVSYFYTSRLSRVTASPAYLRYLSSLLGRRTLIVDLCGTGQSLAGLLRRTQADASIFLLLRVTDKAMLAFYRQSYNGSLQGADLHSITDDSRQANNLVLELLNYASHGMVLDVDEVPDLANVFLPRLNEPEFSATQLDWIDAMEAVVEASLPLIADPLLRLQLETQDAAKPLELVGEAIEYLCREAARERAVMSAFGDTHLRADRLIYSSLASMRRQ